MFRTLWLTDLSTQAKARKHVLFISAGLIVGSIYAVPQPAMAYGDLSAASYISQIILGTIFGGTLSIGTLYRYVVNRVRKQKATEEPEAVAPTKKTERCQTLRSIPSLPEHRKAA